MSFRMGNEPLSYNLSTNEENSNPKGSEDTIHSHTSYWKTFTSLSEREMQYSELIEFFFHFRNEGISVE